MSSNVLYDRYPLFLVPCLLLCAVPIRMIVKYYNNVIPRNVLLVSMGIFMGMICIWLREYTQAYWYILQTTPQDILNILIPIFMVSSLYHTSYPVLISYVVQIFAITVVGVLFEMFLVAALICNLLHKDFTLLQGLLGAVAVIPIDPMHVIFTLNSLARYKHLESVIKIEAVILLIPTMFLTDLCYVMKTELIRSSWYMMGLGIVLMIFQIIIAGCILGKLQVFFLSYFYNQPVFAVIISILMTYITYIVGFYAGSHPLTLFIATMIVLSQKYKVYSNVENCLKIFWRTLHYLTECVTLLIMSVIVSIYIGEMFETSHLYGIVIFFLAGNIVRIVRLLILSPLIKRICYGFTLKYIFIWSLSNIKGIFSLSYLLTILAVSDDLEAMSAYTIEVLMFIILSLFLNCSFMSLLLKCFGFAEIADNQKRSMDMCLLELEQKKYYFIENMKTNRYFANVNWNWVHEQSTFKHPYGKSGKEDENIETIFCAGCEKDVPYDVNESEISVLIKKSETKLLIAKKIALLNQYELGVIDKHCLETISLQLERMIECDQDRHDFYLEKYLYPNKYLKLIRHILVYFSNMPLITPPLHPCRRLCFYLIMHFAYDYIIYVVSIGNATFLVLSQLKLRQIDETLLFIYHLCIYSFYFLDFILKMVGLSYKTLLLSAIRPYFRRKWNIVDFLLLLWVPFLLSYGPSKSSIWVLHYILPGYTIVALIRLLFIISLIHTLIPHILFFIDDYINHITCFGYEMATALIKCDDILLSNLDYIIETKLIRDVYRKEITEERAELLRLLGETQNEKPFIPVTVKTKQAIKIVLTAMERDMYSTDPVEHHFLYQILHNKQQQLRNMQFVRPTSSREIFTAVPWIVGDDNLIEYLFDKVKLVSWDAKDLVQAEGEVSSGVHILVLGTLRLNYTPNFELINNEGTHANRGILPILDFLNTIEFDKPIEDMLISGDSFGEFSFLTGRPYDASIHAVNPSKAYLLTTEVLTKACEVFNDNITGLEARIWKSSCMGIAIALMMQEYRILTQVQVTTKLANAFMPNLRYYRMFIINDNIDDIILIFGRVEDYDTGAVYLAPIVLPRTVQKLALPNSEEVDIDMRLMIVPSSLPTDYFIAEREEFVAELLLSKIIPPGSAIAVASGRFRRLTQQHKNLSDETIKTHLFNPKNF